MHRKQNWSVFKNLSLVVRSHCITLLFVLSAMFLSAQEETPTTNAVDSLKTDLKQEGIVVEGAFAEKIKPINPLAPSKAAFYSAVLPGLGQVYNKKYWKVPLVWGAIGAGIYGYTFYDGQYQDFRTAFKRRKAGFTDDEFYDLRPNDGITPTSPDIDDSRLERLQNDRQNDRDLTLLVTILLYALNVVDANVDAHLKQFNISDDLSWKLDFEPYLDVNPISNDPNYGLALTIQF